MKKNKQTKWTEWIKWIEWTKRIKKQTKRPKVKYLQLLSVMQLYGKEFENEFLLYSVIFNGVKMPDSKSQNATTFNFNEILYWNNTAIHSLIGNSFFDRKFILWSSILSHLFPKACHPADGFGASGTQIAFDDRNRVAKFGCAAESRLDTLHGKHLIWLKCVF